MPIKLQKSLPYLLAAASGLLLALAYPPYDLPGLIWVALVPLFFALFDPQISEHNPRRALWISMIFGLIYFGIAYLPLLQTYPLGWAGITAPATGLSLVFLIWATITIIGTLPFTAMIGVTTFLKKRLNENRTLMIFPFLWIVTEYLRAYFISIALYGKGALLGPHWTTGSLGYALHDNTLFLQSADLWGVYGLSWLIVTINVVIFSCLIKYFKNRIAPTNLLREKTILIPLALFSAILIYGAWRTQNIATETTTLPPVKVALIQTDFQPNFIAGDEYLRTIHPLIASLVNTAITAGAEIIVLPEGSQFVPTIATGTLAVAKHPFLVIDSAALQTARGPVNAALYFDSEKHLIASSEKSLLVFFGEYIPYLLKAPLRIIGQDALIEKFEARRERVPGQEIKIVRTLFGNIGVTICSEPLSPSIVRSIANILTNDRQIVTANMLFNLSSEGLFHHSRIYAAQNQAVLQLRAVENRRPIAQATNVGASFFVKSTGTISDPTTPTTGNRIVYDQLTPSAVISFYDLFGDWIVLLGALILSLTILLIHKRR